MKQFHFLLAAILMLGIGTVALASTPKEKKVVKIEVSTSAITSVELSANDEAITVLQAGVYIAEDTGERISGFHPPTVIGKINSAYKTSIKKPPIISAADFLPQIRRL